MYGILNNAPLLIGIIDRQYEEEGQQIRYGTFIGSLTCAMFPRLIVFNLGALICPPRETTRGKHTHER